MTEPAERGDDRRERNVGGTEPNEPMRYHHSNSNHETTFDNVADVYAAMDERRAIKSLVRLGST